MMKSIRYIIFTGANERAVIASCRYFHKTNTLFSLIGRPGNDKLSRTGYRSHIHAVREHDNLDVSDLLRCVATIKQQFPNDELHFLPTTESVNRLLLTWRQRFEQAGLRCQLCDKRTYECVSDKETFLILTARFGISAPSAIILPSEEDIPFVAKPLQEFSILSGVKIYPELILTREDYQRFLSRNNRQEYFFQKYINGESYYYLLAINGKEAPVIRYQRNLLQQSNGKSVIAATRCECPDRLFEQRLIASLNAVNFHGLIMVEMMKEGTDSWLIEANPRLWGPFQLALQQGIFPDFFHRDYLKLQTTTSVTPYLWINGLIADWCRGKIPRCYFRKDESITKFIVNALRYDIYLHRDTLALFCHEITSSLTSLLKKRSTKIKSTGKKYA